MTALTTEKNSTDALLRLWLRGAIARDSTLCAELENTLVSRDWPALAMHAQAHGVLPLLYELPDIERFCAEKSINSQTIRAACGRTALLDRLHRELLLRLDEQLQALDLPVLVVKGAALSTTHYRNPGLRPRVDTDLFIRAKDRGRWDELMKTMGFTGVPSNFSPLVLPERVYQIQLAGAYLQLDVHWSLSSRPMLGKKLDFSALYGAGAAFEQARCLRMPSAIDALFLAVVHRLGHHRDQERYIWLFDLYLLWSAMDEPMRERALHRGRMLGLLGVLVEALAASANLFPFNVPNVQIPSNEAATALLDKARSAVWFDVKHADWSERWALLRERLWAEPGYLRNRFKNSNAPLWYLQLRRWFS